MPSKKKLPTSSSSYSSNSQTLSSPPVALPQPDHEAMTMSSSFSSFPTPLTNATPTPVYVPPNPFGDDTSPSVSPTRLNTQPTQVSENPFSSPSSTSENLPLPIAPTLPFQTLPVLFQCQSVCEFIPSNSSMNAVCLSFPKHAVLDIVQAEREDWVHAIYKQNHGWVPRTYLVPIQVLGQGKMIKGYSARTEEEVSVPLNAFLEIIELSHPDWWLVKVEDRTGFVPANHIQTDLKYVLPSPVTSVPSSPVTLTESISPSNLDPTLEEEESLVSKDHEKRSEAINEFVRTEAAYVKDLQTVMEVYYTPLSLTRKNEPFFERLFSNFPSLLPLHQSFLKDIENQCLPLSQTLPTHLSNCMDPYTVYCGHQKTSVTTFTSILQKPQTELSEFFNMAKKNPKSGSLDLASFLLKPIQRLTRYPLLIKQILHYTSEKNLESDELKKSLEIAEKLLRIANEAARAEEDRIMIAEILGKVDLKFGENTLDLSSHTKFFGERHFITHGDLSKAKSGRKLQAYLFNDLLLLCEEKKSDQGYPFQLYRAPLPLQTITVTPDNLKKDVFYIHSTPSGQEVPPPSSTSSSNAMIPSIGLRAPSNGRHHWINQIQNARKALECSLSRKTSLVPKAATVIGTLRITVIDGKCLGNSNFYGASGLLNLLVEVTLDDQVLKTNAIRNTNYPKWGESLVFSVHSLDTTLRLVLYNAYDQYSKEEYLGTSEWPLHVLEYYGDKEVVQEIPLQNGVQGALKIKLHYRCFSNHT
ncbi:hypothetical protein HMI55_006497 [Coelomomyces lativittatus]|nr:hypothetical protein HMI55_006497 [Coelomomyces lativittatus]